LQAKLEPLSLAKKEKLAVVAVVAAVGPAEIVVSGAVVSAGGGGGGGGGGTASTVHPCVAGLASVLPAASVALTENWCEPTPRPE
jgi:hypothetical protein